MTIILGEFSSLLPVHSWLHPRQSDVTAETAAVEVDRAQVGGAHGCGLVLDNSAVVSVQIDKQLPVYVLLDSVKSEFNKY